MPDIVINGFLHLVGYRTIVCHFRKDSGLKLFYGHVLWGLGPVYGYLRFFGGWFGCGSKMCIRDSQGIFAAAGYSVGMADMLMRIFEA